MTEESTQPDGSGEATTSEESSVTEETTTETSEESTVSGEESTEGTVLTDKDGPQGAPEGQ